MNKLMQKMKVTYIISTIDKAIAFEWIVEKLEKSRFDLTFILLNTKPSHLAGYLREWKVPVEEFFFSSKKDFPRLLWKVINVLQKEKPDIIHSHLIDANLIGLLAGKLLGVKKRIYTRHDANNRKEYHKKSAWLDVLSNKLSTNIVAISENVRDIMIKEEAVNPNKIRLIYHGFDLERFANVTPEAKSNLARKYNIYGKSPVIGVIARYYGWKGIQYTIPAFQKILKDYPNAFLILANANKGDYVYEIKQLLRELPPESYCEIEFEHNLFALYHLFDVFVHVPINKNIEAFGQIYVEALAAGIPSVFTNSGIAKEFIKHNENAILVDFQNTEEIYYAVKKLLNTESLRKALIKNGRLSVKNKFGLDTMINGLEQLYLS